MKIYIYGLEGTRGEFEPERAFKTKLKAEKHRDNDTRRKGYDFPQYRHKQIIECDLV